MDLIFRLLRGLRPTAVRADASKADASTRSISYSQTRTDNYRPKDFG